MCWGGEFSAGTLWIFQPELTDEKGVFRNLDDLVALPLLEFCARDIRTNLILGHRVNPLNWISLVRSLLSISGNILATSYEELFGDKRLQDLPTSGPTTPRFVFCTTNMNTGACWQFHTGMAARMGDFYTGYTSVGDVTLAEAVAASSAFPLAFAPFRLHSSRVRDLSRTDPWGQTRPLSGKRKAVTCETHLLTDGGVYDNLGLEPIWYFKNTVLISDGGLPFHSVDYCGPDLVSRIKRVASISNEQVGAMRKRWIVEKFVARRRLGALWAIDTNIEDYELESPPGYEIELRPLLANVRTDLNSFSEGESACLQNHGYSLTDAALNSRAPQLTVGPSATFAWPSPEWRDAVSARAALQNSGSRQMLRDLWIWLKRSILRQI